MLDDRRLSQGANTMNEFDARCSFRRMEKQNALSMEVNREGESRLSDTCF